MKYKFIDDRMRIFYAKIIPHDILWFASFDAGAVSVTEPVIHNYALSYAMSRYDRFISFHDQPTYEEDLRQMDWYTTPARAKKFTRLQFTWNAIDSLTQTTEDPRFDKANTPKLGKRHVLAPAPATEFECYLFSRQGNVPPRMIRLGKKRAPCLLEWVEVKNTSPQMLDSVAPTHLVNPIDVIGELYQYKIVSIPPSLLAEKAIIQNCVVVRHEQHVVVLPKRLLVGEDDR